MVFFLQTPTVPRNHDFFSENDPRVMTLVYKQQIIMQTKYGMGVVIYWSFDQHN
jgi:hypothetical protein